MAEPSEAGTPAVEAAPASESGHNRLKGTVKFNATKVRGTGSGVPRDVDLLAGAAPWEIPGRKGSH